MASEASASSNTLTEVPSNSSVLQRIKTTATHWQLVKSHAFVTREIREYDYHGAGTEDDPYAVQYIPNDPRDPMLFSMFKKWMITLLLAFATLAVSFASSAYSGGVAQIIGTFDCSEEVAVLGIALFVVGFAIGPLLWAPLSEMYGRQLLFFITYGVMTAFNAGAAGSQNIETLVILRFFAGAFGSSPLTNAGGVIADMFEAKHRGLAMSIFASAPFMGPTLGPIAGGFLADSEGWRWVMGMIAIFTGTLWIIGTLTIPETYAPVILRKRGEELSKETGKVYKSRIEISRGRQSIADKFKIALARPWILLFREPIVLLLSLYMAIIYGTLYMMFAAFPIVFQVVRHWSAGIGGLPFLGVAVGMMAAVVYNIWDNHRYMRAEDVAVSKGARGAPPEARLPPALVGSVCLPIGLFVFAWTNYPSIHWIVCVIFTAPFGFGMVLVFLSVMNYLIDSYTIYAASVLAANSIIRSLFGAVFPLFTTSMYDRLGIHWASSIPAFLALACVPFPFLFYHYGPMVRRKCKFAREAEEAMDKIMGKTQRQEEVKETETKEPGEASTHEVKEKASDPEKSEPSLLPEGVAAARADSNARREDPEKDVEKGEI